jgi:PAS domain S-box-containing protein
MDKEQMKKMIIGVIIPPALVIVLFTIAIGFIIIPATEDALMQKKQDTVQAIVDSATSILEKHAQMEAEGLVSKEEAQLMAFTEMRALRYGTGSKEYLWITDLQPKMLMHPYFPELEGQMLDKYTDSKGKLLFVEAVKISQEEGEGFIDYNWAKEHEVEKPVPKLSYVKIFKPWGWVVGSGIYLDDVRADIELFTYKLILISSIIGIFVTILLLFMIRRSWKSEKGRCYAEEELIISRERYQALAHASAEMIFLTIDGIIAGANRQACENLGMDESMIVSHKLDDFVENFEEFKQLKNSQTDGKSSAKSIIMKSKNGPIRVLLSTESAIVHDSPAMLFSGHLLGSGASNEAENTLKALLKQNGFGFLEIDNASNGKISGTDLATEEMLKTNDRNSVIGVSLASILAPGDAARLFIQLEETNQVDYLLIRVIDNTEKIVRYLRAWAIVSDTAFSAKKGISIALTDVTEFEQYININNEILAELISPTSKITQSATTKTASSPALALALAKNHLFTETILRNSIQIGLDPNRITSAATESINDIFAQAVIAATEKLGPPPSGFALLAFGSIGRAEPTLSPDQDTAVIFDANAANESDHAYFQQLGKIVTQICAEAGLPPCNAGNTAANPEWCVSRQDWHKKFLTWINNSLTEDLLKVNIFFDFRTLVGNDNFARDLRQVVFDEVKQRQIFLFHLAQSTLDFKLPADILGRIRSDSKVANTVNLKGTMLHFVNFARIYALKNSIHETNTVKRLRIMKENEYLPADIVDETIDAWEFLLTLRLKNQATAKKMNFTEDNLLVLEETSSWDEALLKKAMSQVSNLQRRLTMDFVRMG